MQHTVTRQPTLRDLRRVVADPTQRCNPLWGWIGHLTVYGAVRAALYIADERALQSMRSSEARRGSELWCEERTAATRRECARTIDRLISIYGAHTLLLHVPEDREKDTSEVAPTSEEPSEDSEQHGGDGASGEVEDSAPTGDEAEGQPGPGSAGEDAAATSSAPTGDSGEGEAEAGGGEEPQTGTGAGDDPSTSSPPTESAPQRPDGTDDLQVTADVAGVPAGSGALPDESLAQESPATDALGQDGSPDAPTGAESSASAAASHTPRACYGGQFATLESAWRAVVRDAKQRRAARRLARQLRRLFAGWGCGGLDESPRLEVRRLVEHLAARRGQLGRCVRRELQQEVILLLADVSGSCSAHAADTVAAIAEVARADGRVVLVTHSNGMPLEIAGRACSSLPPVDGSSDAWWTRALAQLDAHGARVVGVVAFGDSDAAWIYRVLAERAPLVWLDSYAKCAGVRDLSHGHTKWGCPWQGWKRPPLAYLVGVGDASTAAEALGLVRRRT